MQHVYIIHGRIHIVDYRIFANINFFLRGGPRLNRTLADPEERIEKFVDTASNGPVQVGEKLVRFSLMKP